MFIKSKILFFDEVMGSIVVNYSCDEHTEGITFNIDLPVRENKYPNEDEILELIKLMEPKPQLERIVSLKNCEPTDYLKQFLPPKPEDTPFPNITGINEMPI